MNFLFAVTDFTVGGITTSLNNLSAELINRGHSVSILNLPNEKGDLPFDKRVKIIPLTGKSKFWNINIDDYKNASGINKIFYLFFGIFKKILFKFKIWDKFIFSSQPVIECDVAVAYRQSMDCYYICKHKTNAKKTIAFIHCEFSGDCSSWIWGLNEFDCIACVSDNWNRQFKKAFPHLKDKVYTVNNLFNDKDIIEKSKAFEPYKKDNKFKIVTVSRIDFWPKRLNLIPQICQILCDKGIEDFKWYIVGDGKDKKELELLVQNYKMTDYICLTGTKENPYPYIKNADIFVMLSDWESYGMVVRESIIVGTPVVSSKYDSLLEVMQDGEFGLITEKDIESIAQGIEKMYRNKELYMKFKQNCIEYKYDSDEVYNQFIKLCR